MRHGHRHLLLALALCSLSALLAPGCGGRSVLAITVESTSEVPGIETLVAVVELDGRTATGVFSLRAATTIPPSQTFNLVFYEERSGPIGITVEARAGDHRLLGQGSARGEVVAGESRSITVVLGSVATDGGIEGGTLDQSVQDSSGPGGADQAAITDLGASDGAPPVLDLAIPDLGPGPDQAPLKDLAAPADLALPKDLTLPLDLALPKDLMPLPDLKPLPDLAPPLLRWDQNFPMPSPSARTGHAMVWDSTRSVVVLYGGAAEGKVLSDTWEWSGKDWVERKPVDHPGGRFFHALAYDESRKVTVLFGGQAIDNGTCQGQNAMNFPADTWEYDAVKNLWSKAALMEPKGRLGARMAYDRERKVSVLFGGFNCNPNDETWEYNGQWVKRLPMGPKPSPRHGYAMAYDPVAKHTLLYGGVDALSMKSGETWSWDGMAWKKLMPAMSPSARTAVFLTHDPDRGVMLMFGGLGATEAADTLEWNGTTWRTVKTMEAPPARQAGPLVYDTVRREVVLFGGLAQMLPQGDTWILRAQ
ncbi:MAG: hypothetical protein EXR72_12195 [Myxococcales bacterium]|nr:hypothetical protein [Myxococcales bacterium]